MKYLIFAFCLLSLVACKKDEPVQVYPASFTFDHVDQTDEGQYLVTGTNAVSELSTNVGTYGAHKDSLKTEIRDFLATALDLKEIKLLTDSTLEFHYFFNGNPVVTPLNYELSNGEILISDPFFSGLVTYDKPGDKFILCAVTPFALPGPNAINPTGDSYLNFNITQCVSGYDNQDYAVDYLHLKNLQVTDTIAVLVTRYFYKEL